MNDRLAKAEALFHEALELPPEQREGFLQQACGQDAELRREVAALLRASGVADQWLTDADCGAVGPPMGSISSPDRGGMFVEEGSGTVIGRYKLLEQIGEGGFGVVYMAEQEVPVRRKVALKIIKLGMDTRSVIARFEAERQALAMMDHPNIAKVLDAGATDTGRPYFVMELVRGVPMTKFCEENRLSTKERLELFMKVCGAIQHAHQKGIIHRDIKPTNVLVTLNPDGSGHAMVIDFGVAKAINQRLTEKTLFTNFAQMIGTPAYMSPEQAEMSKLDVDTRSDVYSLGVLLYELLTGTTPFPEERLFKAGYAEMQRIICEEEPPKPSTRLTRRLSASRSISSGKSDIRDSKSEIDKDLDWIVMKCLEKDRARRYETTNGLAMDIQRHLHNEPIVARPPSSLYRFQKLVLRNKLAFGAVAAVSTALLLGVIASGWQALRATRAEHEQSTLREQAEKARAQAEANEKKATSEAIRSAQVAQFMKEMLGGVAPQVALGRDTTMLREILDKTAERVGTDLKDQPEVAAELLTVLGTTYHGVGEHAKAEEMHREALRLRKSLFPETNEFVAASLKNLARVLVNSGQPQQLVEAESTIRQALVIQRQLFGDEHPDVALSLYLLASTLQRQGKLVEAETIHRQALAMRRKLLGNDHADVASSLNNLARVLQSQRKFEEAEEALHEALAIQRKLDGTDRPDIATSLNNLADVLRDQRRLGEAEALYREALALRRKVFHNQHPTLAGLLQGLAALLHEQGNLTEADALFREALAMRRKLLGDNHPTVATTVNLLVRTLSAQGKLAEAQILLRELAEQGNAVAQRDLGGMYARGEGVAKNPTEAVKWYRRAAEQGLPLPQEYLGWAYANGEGVARDEVEAAKWYRKAAEQFRQNAEGGKVEAMNNLAWLLSTCAIAELRDGTNAVSFAGKAVAATNRQEANYLDTLAAAYAEAGEFAKAVQVQKEAISLLRDDKQKQDYESRLKLYQSHSPYHGP